MALQWISDAWKTHLKTVSPVTDRVYIDFRQIDYPPITNTLTYTALTSGTQWSGYSNATGGYAKYLLDMPTKLVLDIRAKATFAFNTASDQPLASWYVDATHFLTVLYRAADDKIVAKWQNGGTVRELASAALDGVTLPALTRVTLVFDSTTGTDAGSALYLDEVLADDTWSGAVDARTMRLPTFEIRAENGTAGDWKVNTVRFFSGITATAADVANHFKDIEYEEVVWYLNSCALGHTRCNVTGFVRNAYAYRNVEDPDTGAPVGNQFAATLYSRVGEFADDQYAAFAPQSNVYNGTAAQSYLKQRCRVIFETWYGDDFEPLFIGRVDGGFHRDTPVGGISTVSIDAVDQTADLALRRLRKGRFYQGKSLTSATEADSLVHLITRLGTRREVYNYLANSSFENATIANSWTASGGTLTRVATPLIGSFGGQLANASGSEQTVTQIVTFTGAKAVNVGETWTFSIYLKSAGAASNDITLQERDSGGTNGTSTAAYTLAGGDGWIRWDVSRTITDTDSDRLAVTVEVANGVTLIMDCAMLTQSSRAYEWFVLNNNDGSSGTESADDADTDTYDTHGFDVDVVSITHPWVRLAAGDNPWGSILALSQACIGYQIGFREEGVFAFKAVLGDTYSDPASTETITAVQDIRAVPVDQRANKIVVRGDYIKVSNTFDTLWMAGQSGAFDTDEVGRISETVNNGDTWPPPATYGEFVARYDDDVQNTMNWNTAPGGVGVGRPDGVNGGAGVGRANTMEIIGAVDCEVRQMLENTATLTVTTLDTTKYADGAVLLFTNATGSNQVVKDIGLIGKPVYRSSGRAGFVHDAFTDWERVEREGENVLEIANGFIVTKTQVEKIAEWHWKYNSGSVKHLYTFSHAGTWHWMVPGRTYTLTVGGAGQKEYISATVRLVSVSTERGAGDLGTTTMVFRELLQSWVFDSSATARFLSGQDYGRLRGQREVVVASSTYVGRADFYCDGTADQTEINAAISMMNAQGGGTIRLTDGTYTISGSIVMKAGITLRGAGDGTVIVLSGGTVAIQAIGTSGAYMTGVRVENLTLDLSGASSAGVFGQYTTGLRVQGVLVKNCRLGGALASNDGIGSSFVDCRVTEPRASTVQFVNIAVGSITNCTVSGTDTATSGTLVAFNVINCTGVAVVGCVASDIVTGYGFRGFEIGAGNGCTITGCEVSNVAAGVSAATAQECVGILLVGDDALVDGNTVSGVRSFAQVAAVNWYGIANAGDRNQITNNVVRNAQNLMLNGNCEDDAPVPYLFGETNDNNGNCTFARDNAQAHRGTYSYKFTKTNAAGTGAQTNFTNHDSATTTDMASLVAGCTYTLKAWVYIPAASGILGSEIQIELYDYVAGWVGTTTACALAYDAWQQVEVTRTLRAAATGALCRITAANTAALNEYFYVDDIELIPVGVHNEHGRAWIDGGTETRLSDNSWSLPFVA